MRPALEHHLNRDREVYVPKRELVLGAPALLGIFGAVALVCAVCFGYGYSSGHLRLGEGKPALAAKTRPAPRPLGGSGMQAESVPQAGLSGGEIPSMPPPAAQVSTRGALEAVPAPHRAAVVPPREIVSAKPFAGVPVPLTGQSVRVGMPVPLTDRSAPTAAPAAGTTVQIAAVSRVQDAQTLAEALRHDGFTATVRAMPGDKLYHVQIGPFASLDAAKSMRSKLVGNGYNAFIRP